jgi:acetoin utilization deacetylase AcuC-like enzyme
MKIIYHPIFLEHLVGDNCPEQPERVGFLTEDVLFNLRVLELLEQDAKVGDLELAPDGERHLTLFHTRDYVEEIKDFCARLGDKETATRGGNNDTWLSKNSYQAGCYAVGAAIKAAEFAQYSHPAFALVRPPGHHAHADQESGFCIFNNIAVATEYLRRKGQKVMIVDLDLHLGDGTLSYVANTPDVQYFSINHDNIWPYEAAEDTPNTENIFLPEGTNDKKYIKVLEQRLIPAIDEFSEATENKGILAVSMGFDTHGMDYAHFGGNFCGGFILSNQSYKKVKEILDDSLLPYFMVLEGGYHPLSLMAGALTFCGEEEKPALNLKLETNSCL